MPSHRVKEVKTTKTHLCDGCGKTIPAKSIVQNISGVGGKFAYNNYYCKKCVESALDDGSESAYSEHLDIFM